MLQENTIFLHYPMAHRLAQQPQQRILGPPYPHPPGTGRFKEQEDLKRRSTYNGTAVWVGEFYNGMEESQRLLCDVGSLNTLKQ